MHTNQEYILIAQNKGRIDSIISKELNFSRNRVKKLIEEQFVYVNSKLCQNASMKILGGEHIKVSIQTTQNHLQAQESDLEILYQDTDIAVIVKPAGITVHPCPSCEEQTLVHQLLHHFPELQKLEGERPGIVHRLDKDTSGLMIIALHEEARLRLVEDFANRLVHKTYLALVAGLCENGESQESIGRHPSYKTKMAQVPIEKGGRDAYTTWERLFPPNIEEAVTKQGKSIPIPKSLQSTFSLMAVRIYTGRTHQIRVHLSEAGFPLLGDSTYAQNCFHKNETKNFNKKSQKKTNTTPLQLKDKNTIIESAPRQMLHAWKLTFNHPMSGETLSFTCPLPTDFMETITHLWHKDLSYQQIIITGNCGSGKSALLHAFEKKDIPIFSADACVQTLYEPNNDAWYLLKSQYGQHFVHENTLSNSTKSINKNEKTSQTHNFSSNNSPNFYKQSFDNQTHNQQQRVDKGALFDAMQDPHMRRELENIIHPLVFAKLEDFFSEHASFSNLPSKAISTKDEINNKPPKDNSSTIAKSENDINNAIHLVTNKEKFFYTNTKSNSKHFCHFAAAEIPLWHEVRPEYQKEDYHIICVYCNNDIRIERLKARDWSEETIATIDSWQWTQEDKAKNSHYIVDNSKNQENPENYLASMAKDIMKDIAQKQRALLEKRLRILQKNMNSFEK